MPDLAALDAKYERIRDFIGDQMYGHGGQEVLAVAHDALREKWARGEGTLVGIEDLWAHALQEGESLFNQPDRLWGKTTAEETRDMVGQTTIGPWQMTVWNVRDIYGPPYGVDPAWSDADIYIFCRDHPDVQAKMIIDYIERSYEMFGVRSPYAIQRYFWLEPFVRGEIGQAEDWTRSPVASPPPGGTWQDLTDEMKRDTGFYAKQVLLGSRHTNTGLLFWMYVTGDIEGIRDTLRTWRDQRRLVIIDGEHPERGAVLEGKTYVLTSDPGHFEIRPSDIQFYQGFPEIREAIIRLVREVQEER